MAVSLSSSSARRAAFAVLLRVERESAYATELLHSPLLDGLSAVDRNLATEIVMGVLRWQPLLDAAFSALVSTPARKLDVEVLIALRMGVYQLAFLDRIPGHAVLHETVELVKSARKRSAAGMVNAVLRKLESRRQSLRPATGDLASVYAHPAWLVERWTAAFGETTAEKICRFDQEIPSTVVRISHADAEELLRSEGIALKPGTLMKNARVVTGGDLTASKLFRSGRIAIQDEGSQLVAALVGTGQRILDCCAAPGGKTRALADANPHAEIVAAEIHPHRARLLRNMVPNKNVQVITADANELPVTAGFDRVLADVPCSGTGTLARNPEIKWRLTPEDLHDLQDRQIAILSAALKHVAPGGRLVYASCSLEPEENEQVVEACLNNAPEFQVVPVRSELKKLLDAGQLVWQDIDALVRGEYLRTIPGVEPCDGFFGAIIEKQQHYVAATKPFAADLRR